MDRRPHRGTDEGPNGHMGDRQCPNDLNSMTACNLSHPAYLKQYLGGSIC
ncbi:hypothetical protein AYI69_g5673, partial [Smittium culicis]